MSVFPVENYLVVVARMVRLVLQVTIVIQKVLVFVFLNLVPMMVHHVV
jgi:hypothetical protein